MLQSLLHASAGVAADAAALRRWRAERLAGCRISRQMTAVVQLPRTSVEKFDRRKPAQQLTHIGDD